VNSRVERREIRNVIGYIHGSESPDEYVMLGNHYDAWVYGAVDPNSATAVLAELSRAITQVANETGWRPKRSIVLCAWDAEEYDLFGSTEFVEEFASILSERAVAYLNVDLIMGNQSLLVDAVPSLYGVVINAAKRVPNPVETEIEEGRGTVFNTWIHYKPPVGGDQETPEMPIPAARSDHHKFLDYLGVPVVSFTYGNASSNDAHPLYHTKYETPHLVEDIYDWDGLAVCKAVGQFWAEMAIQLADAPVLPIDVGRLARKLRLEYVEDLSRVMRNASGEGMKDALQQLDYLLETADEFVRRAENFESRLKENVGEMKGGNARLMNVERCFIKPDGVDSSVPTNRHLLYSLTEGNKYKSTVLATLYQRVCGWRDKEKNNS